MVGVFLCENVSLLIRNNWSRWGKKLTLQVSELITPVLVTAALPSLCGEPRSAARLQAVQHRDDTGTKKLGLLVAKELELSVK